MIDGYLQKLIDGNNRFKNNKSQHPNRCTETRKINLEQQKPFAIVVGCSDSRVPVEILFDVGIGDIFVVRTAGHILTESGIASIEYAVENLGIKLIIVLGHHNCGAVKTAMSNNCCNFSPSVQVMVDRIKPAIEKAKRVTDNEEKIYELAINYNVFETIEYIKSHDPILKNAIESNKIKIIAANYHIETGNVEFFDDKLIF